MQTKKITGIVIKEANYSESSKILSIYSREFGIISAISKGCRRLKSPLHSVSTKLTYGEFFLNYKEGGLSTLTGVDVIDNLKNIRSDIILASYSMYIIELASQVAKQNNDVEIFDKLISSLKKINEGISPSLITLILELQYLRYLGIDVDVDSCANCGAVSNIVTLNVDRGGYICKDCYENEAIVDSKTIKVIRLFYYVDIDKITKLNISEKTEKEITKLLEDYYDKYSGLYLKSKNFLNVLFK